MAAHKENVKTGLTQGARARSPASLARHWRTPSPSCSRASLPLERRGTELRGAAQATEEQYQDLFTAADEIAERIRALESLAPFGSRIMQRTSSLGDELTLRSTEAMLGQLIEDHEAVVRGMRETAEQSDKLDDIVTTDLLVKRMAFHEKAIWMLSRGCEVAYAGFNTISASSGNHRRGDGVRSPVFAEGSRPCSLASRSQLPSPSPFLYSSRCGFFPTKSPLGLSFPGTSLVGRRWPRRGFIHHHREGTDQ